MLNTNVSSRRDVSPVVLYLLTVLLMAFAACADAEGDAGGAFVVRDSAGVLIAESGAPAWEEGEGWRIGNAPTVQIGTAEGAPEQMLSGVASAIRKDDGTLIIANAGSGEIRFYAPDGTYLRSVGGEGDGPGEFRSLGWIALIQGDSIVAYDDRQRRVSLLTPDGEYVRSTTLDGFESYPQPLTAFADGTLSVRFDVHERLEVGTTGSEEKNVVIARVSREGKIADTLVVSEPLEVYRASFEMEGGIGSIGMPPQFGADILTKASSDRLIIGKNDRYRFFVYRPSGELERVVHRRIEPRPVTEAYARMEMEERIGRLGAAEGSPIRKRLEETIRNRPRASTLPFFSSLQIDDSGNVWVKEYAAPDADRGPVWTVFDPEGRMLGEVLLPERFTPHQIGEDFIVGVTRDELDVERVQVYAIEKERV